MVVGLCRDAGEAGDLEHAGITRIVALDAIDGGKVTSIEPVSVCDVTQTQKLPARAAAWYGGAPAGRKPSRLEIPWTSAEPRAAARQARGPRCAREPITRAADKGPRNDISAAREAHLAAAFRHRLMRPAERPLLAPDRAGAVACAGVDPT